MVTLKMLSDEEVALIFGKLGCLLPLHEELLAKLEQARAEDGKTSAIGYIFVEWVGALSSSDYHYEPTIIIKHGKAFFDYECVTLGRYEKFQVVVFPTTT